MSNSWQNQLDQAVCTPKELLRRLKLPASLICQEAARKFPIFATKSFLQRIEPENHEDPLLLQILPQQAELKKTANFSCDPLQEIGETDTAPCTLQKYQGRLLILMSDSCSVNCRFCFRRHFPKKKEKFDFRSLENPEIHEVILSGGDPLMCDDAELESLFYYMKELKHVNRVRVHTRVPVMIPERITHELLCVFQKFAESLKKRAVYLVLHINHVAELSEEVIDAISQLVEAGIPVLSQTVLLKGINDRFETLFELFETLSNCRVIPYYLHQLDRVDGAAHFEVSVEKGRDLIQKLRETLSGYAVPKYVQEIAGKLGKVSLE